MVTRRGPATVEEVDEALIESVCARLREKLSAEDAPDAEAFARQYYRWVSPDDMVERSELDAYGAALSHFQFARVRQPGETKVRLYNPRFDSHGWESTHTAVEIVTDDMPFLIDSVGMELNRRGFGVHMIIHPVLRVNRDDRGNITEVLPPHADTGTPESVIHVEVAKHTDEDELDEMHDHIHRVLNEVRAAVEDWPSMRQKAFEVAAELDPNRLPVTDGEAAEAKSFLA